MLRKLMKHELIATGRVMWVLYAAVAALSVGAHFSFFRYDGTGNAFVRVIMVLLNVAWVISLLLCMVGTLVLLVRRFYQNLLTDEGYLMFTLPANVHQLVLAKVIVASIWIFASAAVVALCLFIAVVDAIFLRDIPVAIMELFEELTFHSALNKTAIIIEVLAVLFVSSAATCLQFYSAMSIGHGFASHKGLWSVVFYFVQNFVMSFAGNLVFACFLFDNDSFLSKWQNLDLSVMQTWHLTALGVLTLQIIVAAIFYAITVLNLQKRLNLS